MSLTVSVPAVTNRLTSLAAVKRELEITTIADDKLLWDQIQQASDFIVRFTGRDFARERVTEKLPAKGAVKLLLERVPIVTLHSVMFDGSTISSTSYEIDNADAGILFRKIGWTTTQLFTHHIVEHPLGDGRRDWEFDYTAGYLTPGSTAGPSNLPGDVERACIDLVKISHLRRSDDPGIQSQRTGDASESRFGTVEIGIPPSIKESLQRWRRLD